MSMFKNALAFQLPEDFRITPTPADPLPPLPVAVDPGPLELETRGFVPPMPGTYEHLSFVPFGEQRRDVICMQTATRVLPSSVVRDEIAKRHVEEFDFSQRQVGTEHKANAVAVDQAQARYLLTKSRVFANLVGAKIMTATLDARSTVDWLRHFHFVAKRKLFWRPACDKRPGHRV